MGTPVRVTSVDPDQIDVLFDAQSREGEVISVVLKEMPLPDDTVSLEQLLNFRQDLDSSRKMRAPTIARPSGARVNAPGSALVASASTAIARSIST